MKGPFATLAAAALLAAAPSLASAQDTVAVGVQTPLPPGEELPRRVADQLVAFYNSPNTIRFNGRTRIPAGQRVTGDVAIIGGPVALAGEITGDLVVLNGDVTLEEGARIAGDLTVVGGVILGIAEGAVSGIVTNYTAVFRYRRTEDGIEYLGSGAAPSSVPTTRTFALPSWSTGSSEIFLSARAYNRVEALPIAVGPRITTGGRNPLRFDALLIWRTAGGFEPKSGDLGWQVRARQYLLGHREVWLEGGFQNVVSPVEDWTLTNLENSLTLFFFRRDYRDYYMREGWYGLVGWNVSSFFGSAEYRTEDHQSRSTRNVWTIFFNKDDALRPNAAVNEGRLQSILLTLGIDTRNDRQTPLSGWYGSVTLEQAIAGSLSGEKPDFTTFLLDLRRYLRVSRSAVLGVRLVGGGPFGSDRVPAQREHMIGGAGSLPGYDMMQFDCGARGSPDFGTSPGYGCQRFTLFQAEYRSSLDFHWHWDDRQDFDDFKGDIFSIDFNPAIVLFYDAGAAWSTDENYWDHLTKSDNWIADLGAGLDFGGLGFYFAYPLTGSGGVNFVLRLSARF